MTDVINFSERLISRTNCTFIDIVIMIRANKKHDLVYNYWCFISETNVYYIEQEKINFFLIGLFSL